MAHKIEGFVAIVSCCSHIWVCIFTESMAWMIVILEFCSTTIVDEHDADVVAHMAIADHIHIVEESEVAKHSYINAVRITKGCSNQRGNVTINTKTTYIAVPINTVGDFKEIP